MLKRLLAVFFTLFSVNALSNVGPQEAYQEMQSDKAVIIDVREKDELPPGMIKGAKWFPLSKFSNDKNWQEDFRKLVNNKTIYLYCRSGNRSERVLNLLKENGISSQNLGGYEELKHKLPTSK